MIQVHNESNYVLYVDTTKDEKGVPMGCDKNAGTFKEPLATTDEALGRLKDIGSKKGFVRYRGGDLLVSGGLMEK